MTIDVANLLAPEGAVARRLPQFELRPQQIAMSNAVATALENKSRLLVEAGTGIGKTFAYLLPAIKRIVEHEERVVIVTHTINLQEQLLEKDIPLLNAVIPEEFTAVLVKGRGNYVSLRRLKLASERQDRLFTDDDARHSLHMIEDWAYSTSDGSLSTLPPLPRAEVWDYAQSDSHNCMGRKCDSYDKCFYQRARRRMENGDLLVCNHALFFSDLALRSQGVGFLPPYDHVIFDEAHAIEDVAAEHFGLSLSEARVRHLLRLLHHPQKHRGFLSALRLKDGGEETIDQAIHLVLQADDARDRQFELLREWQAKGGPQNGRMREGGAVANIITPVMKQLGDLLKLLRERAASEADQFELNSYAQRANDIAVHADALLEQKIDGCVYWTNVEQRPSRRQYKPRVSLHAAAVDVGPILREHLFSQDAGIVLTSATLAAGPNDFSHIIKRLGCADAETVQLGSPFHYDLQMEVFIEADLPEPGERTYLDALVPRIASHLEATGGGAFVLFTSYEMLNEAAERLRETLADANLPLLVHGQEGPPALLLKRFRQDDRSVLFGTARFWQGVDVQGRGLRNVIITRLPFAVPDQPILEARHEHIQRSGGNAFMEDSLPKAVIRFRQGVGRLIRSGEDEGRIVVLDPRIVRKAYGRVFRDAIPEGVKVHVMR